MHGQVEQNYLVRVVAERHVAQHPQQHLHHCEYVGLGHQKAGEVLGAGHFAPDVEQEADSLPGKDCSAHQIYNPAEYELPIPLLPSVAIITTD